MDAVKDHVIPHLYEKNITREMWEALTKIYESDNRNRKMMLREKLRNTEMTKLDTTTNYLTKITKVCDELVEIGENVIDEEMLRMALNGFTKPLTHFIKGIVA